MHLSCFCGDTKGFAEAINAVKFLGGLKNFGPAQNILGPVKGQGIRYKKIFNRKFEKRLKEKSRPYN